MVCVMMHGDHQLLYIIYDSIKAMKQYVELTPKHHNYLNETLAKNKALLPSLKTIPICHQLPHILNF